MYASQADLEKAVGSNDLLRIAEDGVSGELDVGRIADALERASAEVDSAIGGRYALPIDPVPTVLRSVAIDIARYHLDIDPSEDLRERVKDARKQLLMIGRGEIFLDDAELASSGQGAGGAGSQSNEAAVRPFKSGLDLSGFGA